MDSMMKKAITTLILSAVLTVPVSAFAAPFTLIYQGENRWVAKEDATSLRSLIHEAKNKKQRMFTVVLPEEERDISIERLVVLRDILEQQTKQGVVIEEVVGDTDKNSIIVDFKN